MKLVTCIVRPEKLDEIKETPGMHKAWQDVEKDEHGSWTYYDLK